MTELTEPMRALLQMQPSLDSDEVAAMREHARLSKLAWNRDADAGMRKTHETFPGAQDERPALRLRPDRARTGPLVVHIHGGGWTICDLDTHLSVFAGLAQATRRTVWAPHPRRAPEARYPRPLDDVIAAIRFAAGQSQGGVFLSGDSAGANLALAALIRSRDEGEPLNVRAAVLHYGCYRRLFDTPSHASFGDGFGLTTAKMRLFWQHYAPDGGDYADLTRADFQALPPIQLHLATCDPLADDTRWLAERLDEASIATDLKTWNGLAHGYLHYWRDLADARNALADTAQFLARHA